MLELANLRPSYLPKYTPLTKHLTTFPVELFIAYIEYGSKVGANLSNKMWITSWPSKLRNRWQTGAVYFECV